MMTKKIIMILCAIIFIQNGFAQEANAVYGISKSPVRISLQKNVTFLEELLLMLPIHVLQFM